PEDRVQRSAWNRALPFPARVELLILACHPAVIDSQRSSVRLHLRRGTRSRPIKEGPHMHRRNLLVAAAVTLATALGTTPGGTAPQRTETPIDHVIVIFQENVSFDHYFGTYPNAANDDPSEPRFVAKPGTPTVNGLTGALLTSNPNGANPFRFTRAQAA